jgi:hypothetical protein
LWAGHGLGFAGATSTSTVPGTVARNSSEGGFNAWGHDIQGEDAELSWQCSSGTEEAGGDGRAEDSQSG